MELCRCDYGTPVTINRIECELVMWYFAIYLGRAALKEPESNGSQIRI